MCQLDAAAFPKSLAIVDNSQLKIGTIDDIQKLHTTYIPLYETPWRLVHHREVFAVITEFDADDLATIMADGDHARLKRPLSMQCKIRLYEYNFSNIFRGDHRKHG